VEGRYPFLDVHVVQEFLSLTQELKNSIYKAPIHSYLVKNDYPTEFGVKIGFKAKKGVGDPGYKREQRPQAMVGFARAVEKYSEFGSPSHERRATSYGLQLSPEKFAVGGKYSNLRSSTDGYNLKHRKKIIQGLELSDTEREGHKNMQRISHDLEPLKISYVSMSAAFLFLFCFGRLCCNRPSSRNRSGKCAA